MFEGEDELMFPTGRLLNYASCSNYCLIYFRPLTAEIRSKIMRAFCYQMCFLFLRTQVIPV